MNNTRCTLCNGKIQNDYMVYDIVWYSEACLEKNDNLHLQCLHNRLAQKRGYGLSFGDFVSKPINEDLLIMFGIGREYERLHGARVKGNVDSLLDS
jgi:hypothetical protein